MLAYEIDILGLCSAISGSFEHEHDDEHEHDSLVADFGVRLRRAQSSRSVERSAAPCLCGESAAL